MGIDYGRIVLDSHNKTYFAGQTIRGNLIFQQNDMKTFRAIWVRFRGYCKVHWEVTEADRDEIRTTTHESYDEYVNMKVSLDGEGNKPGKIQINSGKYDYPFSFHIPASCPSSFEGECGHVRYEIKAVVDRSFKLDQEKVAIRVIAPLDLNQVPCCKLPILMEISKTYYCCCFNAGSVETIITAPVSGYCPGQKIPIEVTCTNNSNLDIRNIKLRLIKEVEYVATRNPARRIDEDVITEITKGVVFANTRRIMTINMDVPTSEVFDLYGCSFIDVQCRLEVAVISHKWHSDAELSCKIIIGTIPLIGFHDNIVISPQSETPPQILTIIQQPMSSLRDTSPVPYAGEKSPSPNSNAYPNNSHYPAPNAPLANPSAPNLSPNYFNYPLIPNNDPNPPSNSSYPSHNSSIYLNQNLSYPIGPPLYPGNPPYPTDQQNPPAIGFMVSTSENFAAVPTSPVPVNTMVACARLNRQ